MTYVCNTEEITADLKTANLALYGALKKLKDQINSIARIVYAQDSQYIKQAQELIPLIEDVSNLEAFINTQETFLEALDSGNKRHANAMRKLADK